MHIYLPNHYGIMDNFIKFKIQDLKLLILKC